jgi:hypothetical protein
MFTGGRGLDLPAVDTLINQVPILPLEFMTIDAFPIFPRRDQGVTTRAFNGESPENQKRDTGKHKKRADEFELNTSGKLIEFTGSGQNDIKQKCNGRNCEKFKPKMKIDTFQGFFFH